MLSDTPIPIPDDATAEDILAGIDLWAKKLIDAIDNREDLGPTVEQEEGMRLWRIITALRGPDSGDEQLKRDTTAVLRGAILPHLAYLGDALTEANVTRDMLIGVLDNEKLHVRRAGYPWSAHFYSHMRLAVTEIKHNFPERT